ncbi:hypothetical protein J5N97_013857 [Dioscorea zingiberensis]|uniref:WRKY domain-containing protein n=1 Tax=Dioscorea zingiberensis TaxID=325984 RepID=A0A9D5CU15_9LILI|nr:hypothetical protein J5N97_013857 [Dioscorea zingiberensis]
MDNTLHHILHGCKLAGELRANLPNMAREPHLLLDACKEIVNTFNKAIHGFISQSSPQAPMIFSEDFSGAHLDLAMRDMDLLHEGGHSQKDLYSALGLPGPSFGTTTASGYATTQTMEAETIAGSSITGRRPSDPSIKRLKQKRKDDVGMHTIRVPAPAGNTEVQPDDGFTWRKYGQKDILGSSFPRSYYRCTHKSFYGCNAKKKVQRLNEDPSTYEVTYIGSHSCKTTTMPVGIPAVMQMEALVPGKADTRAPPSNPSTSIHLGSWLTSNMEGSQMGMNTGEHAGEDVDFLVTDLADAMFNSVGSGSSTIDAIFQINQEK